MPVLTLSCGREMQFSEEDRWAAESRAWRGRLGVTGVWYAWSGRKVYDPPSGPKVFFHRAIIRVPDGLMVDHKNGDGLDNRRENLRVVSRSVNQQNRVKVNSQTGFQGVHRKNNRWKASICKDCRKINLGSHKTPEEAARAYDRAALELFGYHAKVNFAESRAGMVEPVDEIVWRERPSDEEMQLRKGQGVSRGKGTSRYCGVHWHARDERWIARVVKDGFNHHCGSFKDEEAAARAYDAKALELYGPGALVNFNESVTQDG